MTDGIPRPDADHVTELAAREHLHVDAEAAGRLAALVGDVLDMIDPLDDLAAPIVPHGPRDAGRRPTAEEDPVNAFIRVCRIPGRPDGPLAGRRAAVKDNIAVAGVPLTNGSDTTPYVPTADAVVVERLLAAGATIVGTLNMDAWAAGVTGATSAFGPARNPHDPARSAGGSSSGSGAALAANLVDVAIGVDQGGSARIPAAFCGVVAIKPTAGLVPSHGVTHVDHTFDSVCPMARSVELTARVLDAVSGYDDRDPQWARSAPARTRAADRLDAGAAGVTVGVVAEAIDAELCEPEVVAGTYAAAAALQDAGARVIDVSVPLWSDARPIAMALWCQLTWAVTQSEGQGYGHRGEVDPERVRAFARTRREEADRYPEFLKAMLVVGRHLHEQDGARLFAIAHNLRRAISAQLDAVFERCDVLLTPTVPIVAPPLSAAPTGPEAAGDGRISANAIPLNLSGHPAVAVPSGSGAHGLPVSAQLVARRFEDAAALGAARVVELALAGRQDAASSQVDRLTGGGPQCAATPVGS
jgi:amidase